MIDRFVASSSHLYILWSETCFQRLWCMCELGTFSSIHGPDKIVFVPLWWSPFILSGHIISILSVVATNYSVGIVNAGAAWAVETYGPGVGQIVGVFLVVNLSNLPA